MDASTYTQTQTCMHIYTYIHTHAQAGTIAEINMWLFIFRRPGDNSRRSTLRTNSMMKLTAANYCIALGILY